MMSTRKSLQRIIIENDFQLEINIIDDREGKRFY